MAASTPAGRSTSDLLAAVLTALLCHVPPAGAHRGPCLRVVDLHALLVCLLSTDVLPVNTAALSSKLGDALQLEGGPLALAPLAVCRTFVAAAALATCYIVRARSTDAAAETR